jgi:hypothetical protein
MIRGIALASAILALAACDLMPGSSAPPPRAPDHPSQSHPVTTPAAQQIQISGANRIQVQQDLSKQLDQMGPHLAAGRTRASGLEDVLTSLQPGGDHQFRVSLIGGTAYSFLGACDSDCTDVDIEVLQASDGLVVGSDLLTDDVPVVDFTPPANADYYVRVILKTCRRAPCYVGARILQAGGPKQQ